jgi:hypothetical protein
VAAEGDDLAVVDVPVLPVVRDDVRVQRLDEDVERLLVTRTRGLVERRARGPNS